MAMKWIGLTGGMGSGKSTVAQLLRERGCAVVDADVLARKALEKDSPGLKLVVKEFGPKIQTKGGELDRKVMADLVFGSRENLLKLEKIVHPIVRDLANQERKKLEEKSENWAFYDVPLLFEKKMEDMFDFVVVVSSNSENQMQRLKKRNSWSETEISQRLAQQIPLAEKIKNADFLIHNDGSVADLKPQIDELLKSLKTYKS